MRILLIHPRFAEGYHTPAVFTPLAPAILAALTPPEHEVTFIDERLEEIPSGLRFDLVGISTCTFAARRAYQIAAGFRARGTPVVLGGFHPTLMPEEAAAHADAVVTGDAEHSWPQVLIDAAAGRLQARYGPPGREPAAGVRPDHTIFRGKPYRSTYLLQFGRGCPRDCEFCAVRAAYDGGVTTRPVADVRDELAACGQKRVFFADDNLLGNRREFERLLEAITPLRLRWSSQIDLRVADDPKLLDRMRRSGCEMLVIGLESLAGENLRQMGKTWNQPDGYPARLARIRKAGIMVYATFVFGYDADDKGAIERTLRFAIREKFCLANFNPLQPFPGTPLYDRMAREGRLIYDRWWLEPGYRWQEALMVPQQMTAAELTAGCRHARERFHGVSSIAKRTFSSAHLRHPARLGFYLAANLISRRDIRAKSILHANAS